MKKLLTVSLFAIMAVSAANADIASTKYVGDQITATAGALSSLATTEKGNLVGAINEVKAEITTVSGNSGVWKSDLEQSISDLTDVVDGKAEAATVTALEGRVATAEGDITALETSLSETGTTGQAIAAAKKAGDDAQADLDAYKIEAANTFMDSGEVSAAITSAVIGDNGALKDYVKTEVFTESQNTQDTTLKQYADNKASEAQAAAEATAASALAAYKTSNDTAVAAAKQAGDDAQATASAAVAKSQIGASDAFAVTDECKATDAVCSLVVRAGVAGWEKVSY